MKTSEESNNELSGTTQFLNEETVTVVTRDKLKTIPESLTLATRVGYDQGLHEFLAKPVELINFVWTGGTAAGASLGNTDLPEDALSNGVYSEKIRGFLGFRGTAVLRLQVNGNKFQQGRLLMVFVPQGQVSGVLPGERIRSLMAATQLPRVELDLSTDTEVVMEIPYISPTPFYNMQSGDGPMGRVYVLVYSPLLYGTGSSSAGVTLWCHFEKTELVAPAFWAQSGRPSRRKIDNSEKELQGMGIKPLSAGLAFASKAAASFAYVPTLSSIAAPASWFLNAMSGVASAFGYSKPSDESNSSKMIVTQNWSQVNANGVDVWPVMAVDGSNKLSILPGFAGTDVDEMSLSHLVQIPAFVAQATWSTSQAATTSLGVFPVTPDAYYNSGIIPVTLWAWKDLPPVTYFSQFFDLWRGSLVLTMKVVKTGFHSGRLLIVFNPYAQAGLTVNETSYLMREVVDIRDGTEFRFVIPYVSTNQYMRRTPFSATPNTGYVNVYVLNELVAPDTVSQSVSLLFELSGGPDFELAQPCAYDIVPFVQSGWTAQSGKAVSSTASPATSRENEGLVAMGSASIPTPSLDPSQYCIGEKVNSILQLMKRYSYVRNTLESANTSVDIRPFSFGAAYSVDPLGTLASLTGDYYSHFGQCFAYGRGGVRVLIASPSSDGGNGPTINYSTVYPSTNTALIALSASSAYRRTGLGVASFTPSYTAQVGATVPGTGCNFTRLNRPSYTSAPEPVDIYTSNLRFFATTTAGSVSLNSLLYRAASDDLTFGYFLGTPRVVSVSGF